MLNLNLSLITDWSRARISVQANFAQLQALLNARWVAAFTGSGQLKPDTIPGNTSTPLYVANTGDGQTLKFDQVDLSRGVKNALPLTSLQPATLASAVMLRQSGSAGAWEQGSLGPGLAITGTTLDVTASTSAPDFVPSFLLGGM